MRDKIYHAYLDSHERQIVIQMMLFREKLMKDIEI